MNATNVINNTINWPVLFEILLAYCAFISVMIAGAIIYQIWKEIK